MKYQSFPRLRLETLGFHVVIVVCGVDHRKPLVFHVYRQYTLTTHLCTAVSESLARHEINAFNRIWSPFGLAMWFLLIFYKIACRNIRYSLVISRGLAIPNLGFFELPYGFH